MTTAIIYSVCGVLAYLLGAIPFGLLIARAKGVDIRAVGSGNIGATNVFRVLGKGWGILAFACDALKGFIPVSVFPLLAKTFWAFDGATVLPLVCACLAIAGHNWPVYLRFKGGKGVATSVGALIGLAPAAAGVGLLTWVLVFVTKRYVSLASIAAAIMVAGAVWIFYFQTGVLLPVVLTVLCGLVIWRHKSNIQRLLHGTENRFEFKKR
ncbi:MAG: glycerol-3-phosphate 1-O-acyltransferase PlsY [Kiritimatiellaeota bacterium]|nr:glycerol-3-phosphate 1-O-acyltransferase PlsY [Kiritimatiellota bacterium]